jgi:hypothetical protein
MRGALGGPQPARTSCRRLAQGGDNSAADGWLVHLGISGDYILSSSAAIRFQTRPETVAI